MIITIMLDPREFGIYQLADRSLHLSIMSEYNRKYVDMLNIDTIKTCFMLLEDRSSSRFQTMEEIREDDIPKLKS